ncbi:phospholipase D-like domain-containing protein [Cellulomonas alba]|uniref:phospholipase D n=1 Tax=Cellulomonas alba TaxID=3053467 RepID=A0ABT7SLB8_9CELL|nr:phospholipase D-like domain-containing protein [Cellulomonas alba]MDM7856352.1 phospholipase D-like domain-containing protein [Cellulomonas alba]
MLAERRWARSLRRASAVAVAAGLCATLALAQPSGASAAVAKPKHPAAASTAAKKKTARRAVPAKRAPQPDPCPAGRPPVDGVELVVTTSYGPGTELSNRLVNAFCAAAPRSTITIELYLVTPGDPQVKRILRALDYVHRTRKVSVSFLVDGNRNGAARIAALRRHGFTVTGCAGGCQDRAGVMHEKAVVVSDTLWAKGKDPVVVLGSANWSTGQLQWDWQANRIHHRDQRLAAAYTSRFAYLRGCAATKTCGPKPDLTTVSTDSGRGLTVEFLQRPDGPDPVAARLAQLRGAPGCRIEVAQFAITPSRARALAPQLGRLRAEGCSVRVVVGRNLSYESPRSAVRAMTAAGVPLRYVSMLHTKFTVARGVTYLGKRGQTVVLDGSHNWTFGGLNQNDDSFSVLTTATASAAHAPRIARIASEYEAAWNRISARSSATP